MFEARLRLARKAAGLTMQQLADLITPRITPQAISKYEKGKMMPSSDTLVELSRNLDVSLDFLMGGKVEAIEGIEFRRRSSVSARDLAAAETCLIESLDRYLMIEAILGIDPAPDLFGGLHRVHLKEYDDAEKLAQELRRVWRLGIDPVPDMTSLLESKGVRMIEADLPENFDGSTCEVRFGGRQPSTHAIVISARSNLERKRFSLAHELAHCVTAEPEKNPEIKPERAMDRFAGAFLVPAEHLRQEAGEAKRDRISYPELRGLKHLYGVSAAAMLMRLGQVGILAETAVERAFRSYARDWRKQEPDPMQIKSKTFEKPQRFERLVWKSLMDQIINSVRAARLLKQPLDRVEHRLREALG